MSAKEFNAKQFLLERGEQVGLGIAVALMVLMLIFNLFMPSKGFLSGSHAEKAKPLTEGSDRLQTALNTSKPSKPEDIPPKTEDRLIPLDAALLQPDFY